MPHIIIENSSDIANELVFGLGQKITNLMSKQEGNFDLEQCKLRNIAFDKYFVGSLGCEKSSFIHITIKIMSGRSAIIKKNLATKTFELVETFFEKNISKTLLKNRFDISVDIVDMDREFYQKVTIINE